MSETAESQKHRTAFQGRSAGTGIAYGPIFFHLEGIADVEALPILEADVPQELARLDSVARAARVSLVHQRDELSEHFTDEQKRIFDAHLRMLEDPVLEADVRGRISEQRMSLEGAVKDALGIYERLFAVVESNALRTKLGDLRDVTLRILRHCSKARTPRSKEDRAGAVLVVAVAHHIRHVRRDLLDIAHEVVAGLAPGVPFTIPNPPLNSGSEIYGGGVGLECW